MVRKYRLPKSVNVRELQLYIRSSIITYKAEGDEPGADGWWGIDLINFANNEKLRFIYARKVGGRWEYGLDSRGKGW